MATKYIEAVLKLKELVIRHGLPRSDYALYGTKCPYCGKIDRVCRVETPENLQQTMAAEDARMYTDHWHMVSRPDQSIGICKFCNHLLRLNGNADAEPLAE